MKKFNTIQIKKTISLLFTFARRIIEPLLSFGCNSLCSYQQVLVYESGAVEVHKLSGLFSSASGDELDTFASFLDRVIWKQTYPSHKKWANWFWLSRGFKRIFFSVAILSENHNARLWSVGLNLQVQMSWKSVPLISWAIKCKRSPRELGALLGEPALWARYSVTRTTNNSTHKIYFK